MRNNSKRRKNKHGMILKRRKSLKLFNKSTKKTTRRTGTVSSKETKKPRKSRKGRRRKLKGL
jgi:hypothetical protein